MNGQPDDEYQEKLSWIAQGVERGWVDPVVCATHEEFMCDEEVEMFYQGADPCIPVMRVHD